MPLCLSLLLAVTPVLAQLPSPKPASFICNYTGGRAPSIECSYDPQAASIGHAGRVVDRILKPIGLMRNFKVMECANTQNCFAAVLNGQRYIIYDAAFMQQLEEATETDWTATSVMAHEIGHHLQGHTLTTGGSTHQKELEADRFSGFVLHQLGATLDEALIAIRAIGAVNASATHPARATRLEAIQKGWAEADALYPRTKPVDPSRPAAPLVSAAPRGQLAEVTAGVAPTLVTQFYTDGRLKYKGGVLMNLRTGYGTYY
ncbi:M48 family metalloprotease [Fibrella aquatilis]|uniref:M48 family metalloprotease n=1 Tax=Fibrella aquatilis TaxID=2817059 RepID=UPI001E38824E|nr:M48 family metalloprotease [Fibrella aquatilis]